MNTDLDYESMWNELKLMVERSTEPELRSYQAEFPSHFAILLLGHMYQMEVFSQIKRVG